MRSPASHETHADDATTDLTQPPEEATDDDSAQRAPRQGRQLVAVLAAVAAFSALAVGGAQWHQATTLQSDRVNTTAALSGLHLGKLRMAEHNGTTSGGPVDEEGRDVVSVWLTVRNEGPGAVAVEAEGISGTYARLLEAASTSRLDPGASTILTLDLAVDCSAVPDVADGPVSTTTGFDGGGATSPESWVALRVTPEGSDRSASQAWRYDTLPVSAYSLPGVMAKFCTTR